MTPIGQNKPNTDEFRASDIRILEFTGSSEYDRHRNKLRKLRHRCTEHLKNPGQCNTNNGHSHSSLSCHKVFSLNSCYGERLALNRAGTAGSRSEKEGRLD